MFITYCWTMLEESKFPCNFYFYTIVGLLPFLWKSKLVDAMMMLMWVTRRAISKKKVNPFTLVVTRPDCNNQLKVHLSHHRKETKSCVKRKCPMDYPFLIIFILISVFKNVYLMGRLYAKWMFNSWDAKIYPISGWFTLEKLEQKKLHLVVFPGNNDCLPFWSDWPCQLRLLITKIIVFNAKVAWVFRFNRIHLIQLIL